jgi:hypothetical protein
VKCLRPRGKARGKMGRSYWFECSKCGYRAKVSGGEDRGVFLMVRTIACRDCKELYDAIIRMKVPVEPGTSADRESLGSGNSSCSSKHPPIFQVALNRLTVTGARAFKWIQYPLRCPAMGFHRVQPWNDPDKCPRCGIYLERTTLPYRIWE